MRPNVVDHFSVWAKDKSFEKVLEVGSLQCESPKDPEMWNKLDMRRYVKTHFYIGLDMQAGPGVDKIINAENMSERLKDQFDLVICIDTLEHVKHPWLVIEEIYKVLKPGGLAYFAVPFRFGIHDYPSDYYRYTEEGMKILLEKFKIIYSKGQGDKTYPHTVITIAQKEIL